MKNKLNYKIVNISIVILMLIIVVVTLKYLGFFDVVNKVLVALTPFYIGFILSWLLLPFSKLMQKKLHLNKNIANLLSLLITLILILAFVFILIPLAFMQAGEIFTKIPAVWQQVFGSLDDKLKISDMDIQQMYAEIQKQINEQGIKNIGEVLKSPLGMLSATMDVILAYTYSIIAWVGTFIAGFMIAFYFMGSIKNFVKATIKLFAKENAPKYEAIVHEMSVALYSYMKGMLIICLSVGIMTLIGASLIGVPSPFLFAVISALTNVVPYVGPIIGGVPLFIAALAIGPHQAIMVIILVGGIQFFEAQIFQPRITAKTTDLHPVTIIVAMLIFAALFGFIGIIIAAPVMTMINVIIKHSSLKDKIKL